MLRRHKTHFNDQTLVTPNLYLDGTDMVVDEFDYTFEGVEGTVPEVRVPLSSDSGVDKFFVAICYENITTGERQVVMDTGDVVVPPVVPPLDTVMTQQGWRRLFLVAQAFVPQNAAIDNDSVALETVWFCPLPSQEG